MKKFFVGLTILISTLGAIASNDWTYVINMEDGNTYVIYYKLCSQDNPNICNDAFPIVAKSILDVKDPNTSWALNVNAVYDPIKKQIIKFPFHQCWAQGMQGGVTLDRNQDLSISCHTN